MLEPGACQAAIGRFALGQFADHLVFGTGVGQHIDKVQYHHIQLVMKEGRDDIQQFVVILRIMYLMVGERIFLTEPLDLRLDKRCFIQVFPFLAVLVHPKFRKHLFDLQGHQPGEDRVAGILCGGRKDAVVQAFVERIVFGKQIFYFAPLVETEIIDQDEEYLIPVVEHREYFLFKQIRAHQRTDFRMLNPVHVILFDKFTECVVCFLFLHAQHVGHRNLAVFQFDFPIDELLVYLHPVIGCQ